jgi:hypothetical protein
MLNGVKPSVAVEFIRCGSLCRVSLSQVSKWTQILVSVVVQSVILPNVVTSIQLLSSEKKYF